MHIHWIVDGVTGNAEAGYSSTLASNRYRAIIPAVQLQREGHRTRLVQMSDWTGYSEGEELPDVCIVGKLLPTKDPARFARLSQQLLNGIATASFSGVTVLGDFSDDHFDNPQAGSYWRALANQVDICTTGADVLATSIRKHTAKPVVTVGDPLASPEGAARVFQRAKGVAGWMQNLLAGGHTAHRLKLVWYGNPGNWMAMQQWAQALPSLAQTQPLLIWIVTRPDAAIEAYVNSFNLKNNPSALMDLVTWDEISQWSIVADADIVLVPTDSSSKTKAAKSANRLTDALYAGRFVVASPIAAYEAYQPYVYLTDEPIQAINEYLADPKKALKMIADGQVAARTRCSVAQVASEWLRAFVLKSPAHQNTGKPFEPVLPIKQRQTLIRLNLGCGDKILPEYINVDVVEARAGKSPDVICDLHALTFFKDNYADEVMAIHVVEHFWRWEIEQILREWLRVLKPGGKMILECPNLLSACEALLAEPEKRSQQDKAGQTSMWVFYGDPGWKDPLMIHRWGYTPYSLAQLMTSVGLVNVRQESAVYKLREPRDMRLIGEKLE